MAAAAQEERGRTAGSSITARKGPFAGTKGFICPVRPKPSLNSCKHRTPPRVPDALPATCWLCPMPAPESSRRTWDGECAELVKHADTRDRPGREGSTLPVCPARELLWRVELVGVY